MSKIATDLEQSKILKDILPLESADMSYRPYREEGGIPDYRLDLCPYIFASWVGYPAWSLNALLDVLPSSTLDSSDDHHYRLHCRERFTEWHDNAVDSCVEMIVKLHEKGLL